MILDVQSADGAAERVELVDPAVVICGFTGRDPDEVAAHIRELRKLGVESPASTPVFIPVPAELLQADSSPADVDSTDTSGEAEPVLIRLPGGRELLCVGSDHTDRALETKSIKSGKEACPKLLGSVAWPFDEVVARWDALELSARVNGLADPILAGTLAAITHPTDLVAMLEDSVRLDSERTTVLFLGTLVGGHVDPALGTVTHYRAELRDPVTDRTLVCAYDIREPAGEAGDAAQRREAAG